MAEKRERARDARQLSALFAQLGMLVGGGIPLWESLETLLESAATKEEQRFLAAVKGPVGAGGALSDGLEAAGGVPEYALEMVRIGEQAGRLPEVLGALAQVYENRDQLRASVRAACAYPMGMTAMVLVVVGVMLTQVLPVFARVFEQLGMGLGGLGGAMLRLGQNLQAGLLHVLLVAAALAAAVALVRGTRRGRAHLERAAAALPPVRRLRLLMEGNRFCYALALLLGSGMAAEQALEYARRLTESPLALAAIGEAAARMDGGASFEEALLHCPLLPREHRSLLKVSFRTGNTDAALMQIADKLRAQTEELLGRFIAAFEPTLVCVLCLVVGAVLLSVMLPLMSVLAGL